MKFLFTSIFICVSHFYACAQINHFIYFQTENKQPFYVKVDDKILSSSPAGYLIVPKLKPGNYKIAFGFPKNEVREKVITYTVDKKDAGYIIKDFGEKGWGLFNLQTFDVIMPGDAITADNNNPVQQTNNDAFSTMLAAVVDDSTIRQKEVLNQDNRTSTNKIVPATQTASLPPVNPGSDVPASIITRTLNKTNNEGVELMYTDNSGAKSDTIRIFLAAENGDSNNVAESNKNITRDSVDIANPRQKESQQQSVPIKDSLQKENASADTDTETVKSNSAMVNSDCKGFASEEDFRKLRKKMAAEDNDNDMIKLAKKTFKSRCFTTGHIKSLSALFSKDEGKYNFFDAAYPFVSDSNNFSTLESELTDSYYISRFKAMIHQ